MTMKHWNNGLFFFSKRPLFKWWIHQSVINHIITSTQYVTSTKIIFNGTKIYYDDNSIVNNKVINNVCYVNDKLSSSITFKITCLELVNMIYFSHNFNKEFLIEI